MKQRITVKNMLGIYENWDEQIDQCYWKTLICHLTTLSAKKPLHYKHFCLQKKVNRLLQLVIHFVQKLTVYSNW